MSKKIIVGALALLVTAVICFGAIFAFLHFSRESDTEPFVSTLQGDIVGFWDALACDPVGDGTAFIAEGRSFKFTHDFTMKYFEYGIEIEDRRATYSWTNETEMLLFTPAHQNERSFIVSFNEYGHLLVEDLGFHVIWTLERRH